MANGGKVNNGPIIPLAASLEALEGNTAPLENWLLRCLEAMPIGTVRMLMGFRCVREGPSRWDIGWFECESPSECLLALSSETVGLVK